MARDRGRPGAQGHLPARLGPLEFLLAGSAAPAGGRGADVAGDDRHADPAVAVQIRHADDDGQFRRPDDHRRRHRRVPADDLSRSLAPGGPAAALVAIPTLALLWWLDPFRVRVARRVRRCARSALPGSSALSIADPMRPVRGLLWRRLCLQIRRSGVDAIVAYTTRGYMESDADVAGKFTLAAAGACRPAAKPPHIIMVLDEFELRHPQWRPASRCRPATAAISTPSTARQRSLHRRRRRRPELVHRIQRADRPVGALVRALRLFRHAHRRRPRRARPAARAAPLRLQDLHALSGATAPS